MAGDKYILESSVHQTALQCAVFGIQTPDLGLHLLLIGGGLPSAPDAYMSEMGQGSRQTPSLPRPEHELKLDAHIWLFAGDRQLAQVDLGRAFKDGRLQDPSAMGSQQTFRPGKGLDGMVVALSMQSDGLRFISIKPAAPPPPAPRALPFDGDDADKEGRRNAGGNVALGLGQLPSAARRREGGLVGDAQADTRLVPRPSTALAGAAKGGGGGIGNGTVESAEARPTSAPPSWEIAGVPGSKAEGMVAPLEAPIVDRSDSMVGQVCVCVCVCAVCWQGAQMYG